MLPSLDSDVLYAADGGLETTMIFDEEIELPCFAAFLPLDHHLAEQRAAAYG